MGYVASDSAQNQSDTTASDTNWVTATETATRSMSSGVKLRVKAGFHASAATAAGDVQVAVHDGTSWIQLGSLYSPGALAAIDRTGCFEYTVATTANHKVGLRCRAGSGIATCTVGSAWVEYLYYS